MHFSVGNCQFVSNVSKIWYANSTVLAVRLAIFSQNHGKVKTFPKSVKYHDGSEDKTVKLFHAFKEAFHHCLLSSRVL